MESELKVVCSPFSVLALSSPHQPLPQPDGLSPYRHTYLKEIACDLLAEHHLWHYPKRRENDGCFVPASFLFAEAIS